MSIKKGLLVAGFLLLAAAQVMAAPVRRTKSVNHTGEIKFGPQLGGALGIGVFGEYALNDNLGIQVSFGYQTNSYSLEDIQSLSYINKNAIVRLGYIHLPVVLRAYPGEKRQFCWFAGLRIGYVTNAKFSIGSQKSLDIFLEGVEDRLGFQENTNIIKVNMQDISDPDKLSKSQIGAVAGFDYEFQFGLTLGFAIIKDFITILEARDSTLNWGSRISLAYNFGRFLK